MVHSSQTYTILSIVGRDPVPRTTPSSASSDLVDLQKLPGEGARRGSGEPPHACAQRSLV